MPPSDSPRRKPTPTEARILHLLSDGRMHPVSEIKMILEDEQAGSTAVPFHISNLRRLVLSPGEDIRYINGQYQHIRIVSIAE